MTSLVSRVLVAVAGLPIVLGATWLGGWWLFALLAVGGLVALHEFYAITRPLRPLVAAGYGGLLLTLAGAETGGIRWMLGGFLATFVLAFVLNAVASTRAPATAAIGSTILGTAWVGFGLGHLILLRGIPVHARLVCLTVVIAIFAAATAAYFVGRALGRHRLAPALSPAKTWEGFVGGFAAAVFVAFVSLYSDKKTFLPVWQAIVLGVVLALAEAMGDLFESTFKRDMQVKDSGTLLGGHGGVLDRIDALLFAFPAAYYLLAGFGIA
jgi:phosphatidate cytidylyltransferase